MSRIAAALFALILACVISSPAFAGLHAHGVGCTTNGADGYSTRVSNPSFIRSDFATYSNQNGHTTVLPSQTHTYCWPGADYGLGYSLGTLTAASAASLQSGCVYSSTGKGVNGTNPGIVCSNVTNLDIEGIDFSDAGAGHGTDCVTLEVHSSSGTFKLGNSYFQALNKCTGPNGWLVNIFSGSTFSSKLIQDVQFDGNPAACTTCVSNPMEAAIIDHNSDSPVTIQRVPATGMGGRLMDTNSYNIVYKWSYLDGLNLGGAASGTHGEIIYGGTSLRSSTATANYAYLTLMCGIDCTINAGTPKATNTAPIYISDGRGVGTTWLSATIDHVISVTNQVVQGGTPYATNAVAGAAPSDNQFNQFTFTNNQIDPNGGLFCVAVLGGATISSKTFSGNVNLFNGSAITDFDATHCTGASPQ